MISLPPVNIPFVADLSKLTAGVQQAQQMVNQATAQTRPIQVQVDTGAATSQVTALIDRLRSLTTEMRNQENANNQQKASIAAMVAEQANLRAQLTQNIENLRANGASARELATANGTLRTSMATASAAITEQRAALTSGVAAQAQYRGAISQTRDQLRQLEQDEKSAAAATKQLEQETTRAAQATAAAAKTQAAASSSASSGGGGFRNSLLGGAAFGAGAMVGREAFDLVRQAISNVGDATVGMNAKLEQTQVAFSALTGSAQTAATLVTQLEQIASHSTFGLAQLQGAAQQMLAFGVSAGNIPVLLQAVQNAAAASGGNITDNLQRITYVISELNSGIPLSARQLRQLATAGVPLKPLAEQLGITTEQLFTAGKTGIVTSEQISQAFQKVYTTGKLGDFMTQQAGTFSGAMSIIKTNLSLAAATAFEPLFRVISDLAIKIGQFVQTATFNEWVANVRAAVQSVVGFFGQLIAMAGQVATALGIHLPTIDLGSGDTAQFHAQAAAANDAARSQTDAAREAAGYKTQLADAESHLKGITAKLDGIKDKQAAVANQISDIKQGYDDQIKPLERQLAVMNQLSDAEKARQSRSDVLEVQKIQLEINKPDTSGLDAAIEQLKRDKQDLGKFDSSQWDKSLEGLQDKLKQIGQEDTKTLAHAMQGVQEQLYQLGRENTKALDEQIKGVQKNIANLGKGATESLDQQIQAFHDKIDGISTASIDVLDKQIKGLHDKVNDLSTASIDALTKQLDELQERLKGFNTDALDRQIAGLQLKMKEPPADTSGLTNEMTVLASQLGGPNDSAVRQQFASVSAQKAGILTTQQLKDNAFKQQLASLQYERDAQKLANDDAKKAIQNQIDGITETRKGLQDANAERKKGWEEEIKSLERNKQSLVDTNTEKKKGWEGDIKALQATKRGVMERIATEKEALQVTLDGLQAKKQGIDDERTARRDALQDQLHGMEQAKRLADEDRASRRQGIQDQIDAQTEEKKNAKAIFDQNIATIDASILALTRQKEDALAPFNAAMKRIDAEKQIIGLLDQQAALTRRIAEAPIKASIESLKQAEQDALDPLQDIQKGLEKQTRELDIQKRKWDLVKVAATDAKKAMLPADPIVAPLGMPGAPTATNPVANTGVAKSIDDATKKLKEFTDWVEKHQEAVRIFAVVVGGLALAFGALKLALIVKKDFEAFTTAISLLTNPLGLVVLAIAALAAGVIYLYTHYKPFHDAINEIVRVFKDDGFAAGIRKIGSDLGDLAEQVIMWARDAAPKFLAQLGEWGKALLAWVQPYIGPFLEEAGKVSLAFLGWIKERAGDIAEKLLEWGKALTAWIAPKIPPLLDELGKLSLALLGWLKDRTGDLAAKLLEWGGEFIKWVGPKIPPLLAELGKLLLALLGWLGEKALVLGTKLLEWAGQFIAWVAPHIPKLLAELVLLFARFLGWIAEKALVLGVEILVWGVKFIAWVATHIPKLIIELDILIARLLLWVIEQIPSIVTHMAKWGVEFLQWIIDVVPKLPGELLHVLDSIGIWVAKDAIPFLKNAGTQIAAALMEGFGGLANDMRGPINEGIGLINGFLSGIEGAVHAIGDFFDIGGMKTFKIGQITPIAAPAAPGVGGGAKAYAIGTANHPGGPAIVAEDGRELVKRQGDRNTGPLSGWELISSPTLIPNLPTGATVIPNGLTEQLLGMGVPGFAFGLGDILGGATDLLGGAKDALANLLHMGIDKVTSAVTDHIPHLDLKGAMGDAGHSLYGSAAKGVVDLVKSLWGKLHHDAPAGSSGGRFNSGGGALMDAILAATSDDHMREAMAFGAGAETGGGFAGPWPDQGGGPAVGPFQIEALPGGSHYGGISPEDARDPFKAARFMTTGYNYDYGVPTIAAALWESNFDEAAHLAALHSERPHDDYNPEQQSRGRAMAEAMRDRITKGFASVGTGGTAAPSGPAPTGDWAGVVQQAIRHLGEIVQPGVFDENGNPVPWNGWCEKFMDNMDDAAGFGSYRAGTAFLHGLHSQQTGAIHAGDPNAPAGASVWFDQSWGSAGHAAIATGNGSETISTPIADGHSDIHYANIIGNNGYMGWAPPGMATGGVFATPTTVTVGDIPGRIPEIVAPQPMMKQTVKDAILELGRESGLPTRLSRSRASNAESGDITVVFESGAITVDKDNQPVVNENQMTLRRARIEAGLAG